MSLSCTSLSFVLAKMNASARRLQIVNSYYTEEPNGAENWSLRKGVYYFGEFLQMLERGPWRAMEF